MKNREGYFVDKTKGERECTKCRTLFKITSETVTLCKKCNSERVKSLSPEYKMYNRAYNRAKKSGIEFTITKNDIVIPEECPVLKVKMKAHSGSCGGKKYSPSLDRIDSSKGYTKDNIQVISQLANQMKSHATKEELLKFAKYIIKISGQE